MDDVNSAPTPRKRVGARARWAVGLGAVAALTGLCVLGASLAGGGSGNQAAGAALTGRALAGQGRAAGAGGQAGLPAALWSGSLAAVPGQPAGQASGQQASGLRACVAAARHLRAAGRRLAARERLRYCLRVYFAVREGLRALLIHALHGQVTFATAKGPRTVVFERGALASVSTGSASAGTVTVKAADGTDWTWTLTNSTVVTHGGRHVGQAALVTGQHVLVIGEVAGAAKDARRVVIIG